MARNDKFRRRLGRQINVRHDHDIGRDDITMQQNVAGLRCKDAVDKTVVLLHLSRMRLENAALSLTHSGCARSHARDTVNGRPCRLQHADASINSIWQKKNICFETSDQFTQAGLTESRKVEWNKWKHFNAVYPVSGPELEQLLVQGHKPIPLQWVEIDKNEHERREGGPHVAPMFKSRLVSRGDLEETTGVRTDSPTCDIERLNIPLSWVSCERLTVKSGDITNAYFLGCPIERLILMRPPLGAVPDVDISVDTMFVARVPIYGTCDAGRGFWKKLRHDILSTGLKENAVLRALYIYQEDGEPKSMLATHVDDTLWATKPGSILRTRSDSTL